MAETTKERLDKQFAQLKASVSRLSGTGAS